MGERKICDHCHKNDAVTSYETKKGGKTEKKYYCLPCHEQLFLHARETNASENLSACPYCDTSVEQFCATKLVGCSYCYQTLYSEILPVIVKMQGDNCGHRGKRPPLSVDDEKLFLKKKFADDLEQEKCRVEMEQRERFLRQKGEMEKLIEFLSENAERQQEYKDKLGRMQRRGVIEEEIVW